jgi:hypothetical protein
VLQGVARAPELLLGALYFAVDLRPLGDQRRHDMRLSHRSISRFAGRL